ncbi:MAG: glycosyltransferase [Anaerolineae bacterium]|jgi:1,2-diacylglycerol 3-beta-galactosyltransferase
MPDEGERTDQATRFLFLHSKTGGGHQRAAEAVATALVSREGRAQVELLDAFAAYAPWPFCRLPDWYREMLWDGGRIYGLAFRLLDGRRRAQILSHLCWLRISRATERLLKEHPADVVAVFHAGLVSPIARALSQLSSPPSLVGVGTDLMVMHALWVNSGVWRYLVATKAARRGLIRHGVNPDRVEVTGLPVARGFVRMAAEDPRTIRSRLGLDPVRPLVLVMAGGVGFARLDQVVRSLSNLLSRAAVAGEAQIAVLVGRNERLRARLVEAAWPGLVSVKGFTHDVHRWMRAADLLVTKAGPNTIAEALVVGVPLVLWGAIPAQETPNVQLVVQTGAGMWRPDPRRAAAAVVRLLGDPSARAQMRKRARRLARPEAAERVAGSLWETALGTARQTRG